MGSHRRRTDQSEGLLYAVAAVVDDVIDEADHLALGFRVRVRVRVRVWVWVWVWVWVRVRVRVRVRVS